VKRLEGRAGGDRDGPKGNPLGGFQEAFIAEPVAGPHLGNA
jgi:hypothetical protein